MDKDSKLREIFRQIIQPLVAPSFTVTPLCYVGAIAGSEFETFDANKIYLVAEFEALHTSGGCVTVTGSGVQFYNELNVSFFRLFQNIAGWDVTAAGFRYGVNNYQAKNFYFARLAVIVSVTQMRFIGYRIDIL